MNREYDAIACCLVLSTYVSKSERVRSGLDMSPHVHNKVKQVNKQNYARTKKKIIAQTPVILHIIIGE